MSESPEPGSPPTRFTGDRYQRLRQGAEVLAQDPALADGAFPFNGDGLSPFVTTITEQRLFDCLSERDADVVTMLLLLDYHQGPRQVAARIHNALIGHADDLPSTDNCWAVISGLAAILALMADIIARLPATAGGAN